MHREGVTGLGALHVERARLGVEVPRVQVLGGFHPLAGDLPGETVQGGGGHQRARFDLHPRLHPAEGVDQLGRVDVGGYFVVEGLDARHSLPARDSWVVSGWLRRRRRPPRFASPAPSSVFSTSPPGRKASTRMSTIANRISVMPTVSKGKFAFIPKVFSICRRLSLTTVMISTPRAVPDTVWGPPTISIVSTMKVIDM